MPKFETFGRNLLPLKRDPHVTIQRRGTISMNKSAHVALGSPVAVELLFDASARILGIRAVDTRAEHAHFVRSSTKSSSGPFVVSGGAFAKFYDIDITQARRWPAYIDGDILCVNLAEPATAVTSNRAADDRPRDAAPPVSLEEPAGDDENSNGSSGARGI